ncbi:MAG TPA: metalloregulator ArsR/SmtB family transcription factor [Actinoplanes sp.]
MDAVKVVAEPRRQELLRLCWQQERTAGALAAAVDITFGAVSQHLKVLRDANLVSVRRDGTRRYYRANRVTLGPLADYLETMWAGQIDRLASLAEAADTERTAGTAEAPRIRPMGGPTV